MYGVEKFCSASILASSELCRVVWVELRLVNGKCRQNESVCVSYPLPKDTSASFVVDAMGHGGEESVKVAVRCRPFNQR